jgi:hypothetical protein
MPTTDMPMIMGMGTATGMDTLMDTGIPMTMPT